jgi:hypothetical protein
MHSYDFGGEKRGHLDWDEGEMSDQTYTCKGHLHTSKKILTVFGHIVYAQPLLMSQFKAFRHLIQLLFSNC